VTQELFQQKLFKGGPTGLTQESRERIETGPLLKYSKISMSGGAETMNCL
jgi:hypothetical protein